MTPRRTVEKCCCVDARAWLRFGEVPQLAQWLTLAQCHAEANGREGQLEDDGAVTQITKDFRYRCEVGSVNAMLWSKRCRRTEPEIHAKNGCLDEADDEVVGDFDGQCRLQDPQHVVRGQR